jgi:hypothetical protein
MTQENNPSDTDYMTGTAQATKLGLELKKQEAGTSTASPRFLPGIPF